MTTETRARKETRQHEAAAAARKAAIHRTRRRSAVISILGVTAVAAVVGVMMLTSQTTSSTATRTAPDFTLTDTNGKQVHLTDYRQHNVLLYFSEGAGCGACLQQMTSIEGDRAAFDEADVVVLPVVMNSRDQIMADMAQYGTKTPFLLDDGTVSREYDAMGKGMHAGLPGHGFVLIDKSGMQRWTGEYPSMWLAPSDLLSEVSTHLSA